MPRANCTLSFDALRSALAGIDAWILVLDTKGINVWCAAGKGTFGSAELVKRIKAAGPATVVSHRKVIVPQLGAPGISWPDVLQESGFMVKYGPVRPGDCRHGCRGDAGCSCAWYRQAHGGDLSGIHLIHGNEPAVRPGPLYKLQTLPAGRPHAVFAGGSDHVELARPSACMECGACALNCPVQAIAVQSGAGCAWAMTAAALRGMDMDTECNCGVDDNPCCGGSADQPDEDYGCGGKFGRCCHGFLDCATTGSAGERYIAAGTGISTGFSSPWRRGGPGQRGNPWSPVPAPAERV